MAEAPTPPPAAPIVVQQLPEAMAMAGQCLGGILEDFEDIEDVCMSWLRRPQISHGRPSDHHH